MMTLTLILYASVLCRLVSGCRSVIKLKPGYFTPCFLNRALAANQSAVNNHRLSELGYGCVLLKSADTLPFTLNMIPSSI